MRKFAECLFIAFQLSLATLAFAKSEASPPLPSITLRDSKSEVDGGRFGLDSIGRARWIELESGLDFCEFRLNSDESKITALRIDPQKFDFFLGASSQDGREPRSLDKWAADYNLAAAINASMYLPDNRTSTGYMRSGEYVNQGRVMDRFGAFFVASPKKAGIPRAAIIDKDLPDWRERLEDYDIVVQNYRMINANRRILWSPGGPLYAISAIAQDGDGKILFLHSRTPVEAYSFAQHILHLPIDVRAVMYVEGGAQAGLLINSGAIKRELGAPHAPSFLATGALKAALPNIIGVKQNNR